MIIKNLEQVSRIHGHIDALDIVNKDGVFEYSAVMADKPSVFKEEPVIGKHILQAYPELTPETSTHLRVQRTGEPIIAEQQTITNLKGKLYELINYTFPIFHNGAIIGSFEASIFDTPKVLKKHKLYELEDIITTNPAMMKIKDTILKIARHSSSVMIYGETGTGKELAAQSIHSSGMRKDKSFISVNCSAIPQTLLESILFGTVKGSFTGAEDKKGLLELANGGTLFLDEINSMDLNLQAKLLKVLEEKRFLRLGGNKYISVDIRILSAMNVPPFHAVERGIIRMDLFYRLGVIQIELPPLRERREDISCIAEMYIKKFNKDMNKGIKGFTEIALNLLLEYNWPGNVRELKNAIEYAFNLVDGDVISLEDIPHYILYDKGRAFLETVKTGENISLTEKVNAYEKQLIEKCLLSSRSITDAARRLGIKRQALQYKMEKYGLKL